jgi:putative endonuclease
MQFLKKDKVGQPTTKARGDAGEDEALAFLQARGLRLLQRNYRTPGRGGGEIDLIMQSPDGTVVFVEVRKRGRSDFGGAAATIGHVKQRRIVLAARHYLLSWRKLPPARFDVVALDDAGPQWLQAAFDASS